MTSKATIRVTSGTAKNKKLILPPLPELRVSLDKVRQALFSIISANIPNANCLDLFAGSGGLGIEALSRGAAHCDFVDASKLCTTVINQNLQNCQLTDRATVYTEDALKFVANTPENYDVIFADPFFSDLKHRFLFKSLAKILVPDGIVVFSHSANLDIPNQLDPALVIVDSRKYGETNLTFLKLKLAQNLSM